MVSRDQLRMVFDGFCTHRQKAKKEFRCWLSCHNGKFAYSSVEAPQGQLADKRQLLLTILTNVRITKGAFEYKGTSQIKVPLVPYRLNDGSASFKVPQNWRVQEHGSISIETLRTILHERKVKLRRIKTWKECNDPRLKSKKN